MLSIDRDYLLKWLFSKDSCKSAHDHRLLKYCGRALVGVFSKYWLFIGVSMLLRNSILLRADHPGSGSGPPSPALLWRSVGSCSWSRPHSPPHRWQVTCGTTGDMTGGGADNTLVTGDMWPARAQAPHDPVGYPLEVRSGASCLELAAKPYTFHSHSLYQR